MERQWSVNGASTIFDLASWIIKRQWNIDNPQWTFWQTLLAKMLLMISCLAAPIERPHSVNCCVRGSECYPAMHCIVMIPNRVLHSQTSHSVLAYNFTNMHAMSYRSHFVACSCRVNM
jgi:hypothetical protein